MGAFTGKSATTVKLHKNAALQLLLPTIDFLTDKIDNKQFFRCVKLNHTYWEMRMRMEPWYSRFKGLHGVQFLKETEDMIRNLPNDFILCVAIENIVGIPPTEAATKLSRFEEIIKASVPPGPLYYGMLLKHYTITNQISLLIRRLRKMNVVVVGFKHLEQIKKSWGIKNFNFIEITVDDATPRRFEIVDRIKAIRESCVGDMVCLFQAGELLSLWFIHSLKDLESTYLIDMGRSLDAWVDLYLTNKNSNATSYFPDLVGNKQPWRLQLEQPVLQYRELPIL